MSAEAIARLLEAKQHDRALSFALEMWRRSRSTTIADFIDRLDRRAPADEESGTRVTFQKTWLARADQPTAEQVGWLARTLTHKLPAVKGGGRGRSARQKYAPLFARLDALAHAPNDPRMAAAVARIVIDGKLTDESFFIECSAYMPCFDLLIQIGDPRQATALDALLVKPRASTELVRTNLAGILPKIVGKLASIPQSEPDDRDAWAALCRESEVDANSRATADALVDEVLDDPEDLELRVVCADALHAIGDPRGEFITLQMQAKQTPETRRRIRELIAAHAKDWLGDDLALVLRAVEFRNGFPEVATLAPNHAAPEAVWQRAVNDRRLATLKHLHKGNASKVLYAKFKNAPAAKSLA